MPRLIERTREGLRRIERIVKDLRLFARVDEGEWNEVDLNPGIESSVNMVQGYARKKGVRLVDRARAAAAAPMSRGQDSPGRRQPAHERHRRLRRRRHGHDPHAGRARRPGSSHRGRRHRLRHGAGDPRTDLRPVLHHQAHRRGDRARSFDQLRDRPGAPWNDRRSIDSGRRILLHHPAATRARSSSQPSGPMARAGEWEERIMKLGLINSAWVQAGRGTAFGIQQDQGDRLRLDRHLRRPARYRRQGKATDQGRVRQGRPADRERRLRGGRA